MTDQSHDLAPPRLTAEQAREQTDDAKRDHVTLWLKLYALHEGGAHTALGYDSWQAYYIEEFGGTAKEGQRLLNAGRVRALLERKSPMGLLPSNERVVRELAPVMHKAPDRLVDVWGEATATSEGEQPTAAEVRAVVDRQAPQVRSKPRHKPRESADLRARRELSELIAEMRTLGDRVCRRLKSEKLENAFTLGNEPMRWREQLRRTTEHVDMAVEMIDRQMREAAKRRREA